MRSLRISALALAAGAALLMPRAAEAQLPLKFGVHVAAATSSDQVVSAADEATYGLGARVGIAPPLLPIEVFGTVDYFFPDCSDELSCGYQNFALDANLKFPLPLLTPYVTAGYTIRRSSLEGEIEGFTFDESDTAGGFTAGAGVRLGLIVNAFAEARREFHSDENGGQQWLVRLGLQF